MDWTKLSNIKQMYEYIYNEMIEAHIVSPSAHPVFDCEGDEVKEVRGLDFFKKWQ